jgi:hypothetical protein
MNHTTSILTISIIVTGIVAFAIWSNSYVYARQFSSLSSSAVTTLIPTSAPKPEQHIAKIKISSPTRGQQVPVGKDLTVSGTSIDNSTANTSDCKVSVIVNKIKPYQPATSATGGSTNDDYSKWNFVLTSKYTTIKSGQNRITAKYECGNNAALTSFSSVNVTGVPTTTATTAPATATKTTTTTATAASAVAKQQQQQHPVTTSINNPASASNSAAIQRVAPVSNVSNKSLSSTSAIAPQVKAAPQENAINQQQQQPPLITVSNGTAIQNSTLASPPPPVVASDKLMYLGYPGDSSTNNDLTGKSTMSTTKSTGNDYSSITDDGSTNNGSVDTKSSRHSGTDNDLTGKSTMSTTKSTGNDYSSSITDNGSVDTKSSRHKDSNTSTSQIEINRNTDNVNNNFIFPFSYP